MSPQVFHIERLSISRMPGFRHGLQLPEKFGNQLVIFIGANGSGKTSTSKAILKSIWADNTREYMLDARAVIGADQWHTRLDSGYVERQRNGQIDQLDGLPPSEEQGRYLLAMHQLILDDDVSLAEEINRELSGGYDLSKAGAVLSFGSGIINSSKSEVKNLQKAKKNVVEEQREQEKLKRLDEELADKVERLERLTSELQREKRYEAELRVRKAEIARSEFREAFSLYPEEWAHFTLRDVEDVDNWEKYTENLNREQESLLTQQRELRNKIQQLNLPKSGITREQVIKVSTLTDEIEQLAKEIDERKKNLTEAKVALTSAAKTIGLQHPDADWPGLRVAELSSMEQEWTNAHAAKLNHQQLNEELARLEKQLESLPSHLPTSDSLVNGLTFLSRWLQEQQPEGNTPQTASWVPFAWTILSVGVAVLAFLIPSLWWLLLSALGAGVLLYLSLKPETATAGSTIDHFRNEYERTGLATPKSWQPEEVSETIRQLIELMKMSSNKTDWTDSVDRLKPKFEGAKKMVAEMQQRLNTQREALGMAPIEIGIDHIGSFNLLVDNVKKWQKAQNELNSIRLQLDRSSDEMASRIEEYNGLMASIGWAAVESAAACRANTRNLLEVNSEWQTAQSEIKNLEININGKKEQVARNQSQVKAVYDRLKISENHRHQLQVMAEKHGDYTEAKEALEASEMELRNAKNRRDDESYHEEKQVDVNELSVADIETKLSELKGLHDERDELQKLIAGQRALIEQRQGGRNLEDALAEQDGRFEDLELAFEKNLEQLTGQVVMDVLSEAHHQKNDSSLFQKADQLFGTITQNRYSLLQPAGEQKTFRAYDEVNGVGLGLPELSTGTRIQLLLAVRLAYIETQERRYRLPLLADELLGNSDDVRADAIIEALVEVCKSGRQVFYFTAQNDELRKWKSYLEAEGGIDFQVVPLDGASETLLDFSEKEPQLDILRVEQPNGLNHREYGERIGVERFDPLRYDVSKLHLWYLIDDVELLYNALKNGITHWGQMRRLGDKPLHFAGEGWPAIYQQLEKRATVVEAAIEQHRRGRGTPIDRSVLIDSGAVSETFIDETAELLESLNGDPDSLLQMLENKAIKGFRVNSREELADYLQSKRLLAMGEILTSHDWWSEVNIAAVRAGLESSEAQRVLSRFDFTPENH